MVADELWCRRSVEQQDGAADHTGESLIEADTAKGGNETISLLGERGNLRIIGQGWIGGDFHQHFGEGSAKPRGRWRRSVPVTMAVAW